MYILETGSCKTIVFHTLGANSIAGVLFCFFISSKARGRSSQRSCAVCFLIYVYLVDISRLKSGIRRTHPYPCWIRTKHVDRWIFHVVRQNTLQICFAFLPKYSRVKGGDMVIIIIVIMSVPKLCVYVCVCSKYKARTLPARALCWSVALKIVA